MTRFTTDDSLDLDGSLHFDVTISTYGSFRLLGTLGKIDSLFCIGTLRVAGSL